MPSFSFLSVNVRCLGLNGFQIRHRRLYPGGMRAYFRVTRTVEVLRLCWIIIDLLLTVADAAQNPNQLQLTVCITVERSSRITGIHDGTRDPDRSSLLAAQ